MQQTRARVKNNDLLLNVSLHTAARVVVFPAIEMAASEFEAHQFSHSRDKFEAEGFDHVVIISKVVPDPTVVVETVEVADEVVVVLRHSGRSRPKGVLHKRSRSLANFLKYKKYDFKMHTKFGFDREQLVDIAVLNLNHIWLGLLQENLQIRNFI